MAMTRVFSRRRLLTAACASTGMLIVGCSRNQTPPHPPESAASPDASGGASTTATEAASTLPFSLTGVSVTSAPTQVEQAASPAELSPLWTLGGDFAEIGVLPLSSEEVFGSASANPNALMSYAAAVLTADGPERLTPAPPAVVDPAEYFEPQDGTATEEWIVWKAATVDLDSETAAVTDNWQLWAYPRTGGGAAAVVGSAQELNGTAQTPAGPLEVVPTTDGGNVYWASAVTVGDQWERQVLCYPLDRGGGPTVVGPGDLPAAVDGGVLYAVPNAEGMLTTVAHWDQSADSSDTVLSITSADASWQLTGLWASGSHRAVAVSSTAEGAGTYIGLWEAGQSAPDTWLHAPSTIVIGSAGAARFAWGSGSDGEQIGMYAVAWDGTNLVRLGDATGYSRPALSPDGTTVLVPSSDGMNAVSWTVASF